jgi:hypothetical protein
LMRKSATSAREMNPHVQSRGCGASRRASMSSATAYCPRLRPAQSQFSDWYRCPVAVVMVMPAERCPVAIPARASPAERQLSDWCRCPVAMAIPSD